MLMEVTKTIFIKYIQHLNSKLQSKTNVYIFGAHVFTQSLINYGLCTDNIIGILDNDTEKIGKRLYGTQLRVFHPNTIEDLSDCFIILNVGPYTEEVTNQLKSINKNTSII